ncbi:hypothetical protein Ancab_028745 [Ancistrocladus abbreviatus]
MHTLKLVIMAAATVAVIVLLSASASYGTGTDFHCLRAIKDSLEDPHGMLSSWNFANKTEGSICYFAGIDCWHPDESRVLHIGLADMGLKGQFPRGVENCTSLTGLDLSNNELTGPIPSDIDALVSYLTRLDLSYNNFGGEITPNLANCSFLSELLLDHNLFQGQIPPQLHKLRRLMVFDVGSNSLSGPVPEYENVNFTADSYRDNPGLCGGPLVSCPRRGFYFGMNPFSHESHGINFGAAIVGFVIFYWLVVLFFFFIW